MKNIPNQTNLTYDPNIKPFYKSEIKYNDKPILLYDLDVHCNNLLLAKNSFMVEYYTPKNECLIIPKVFAQNLFLTDENILDSYIKTQQSARDKIKNQKSILSVITIIYIFIVIISVFKLFDFNLIYITIPYVLFYLYTYFFQKNRILKNSYKNFIYILTKKHSNELVNNNIDNIIEHTKTLNYMNNKQKLKTTKHFESLKTMV